MVAQHRIRDVGYCGLQPLTMISMS
ncbi:hypothetical protein CBM2634_A40062 [Cupriavidus taiwanensis]|uniref:Uncharacterized protein n=1 Tax=Cupriavidus taiwanensis TaxID=164546 RepID=A0A375J2F0_9BURK|nr:hypothetical protein CBM2634_A40062 [Cupriavidus taiwanensis]